MYKSGLGVDKDLKAAAEWLRRSAAQGNEKARRNLEEINAVFG